VHDVDAAAFTPGHQLHSCRATAMSDGSVVDLLRRGLQSGHTITGDQVLSSLGDVLSRISSSLTREDGNKDDRGGAVATSLAHSAIPSHISTHTTRIPTANTHTRTHTHTQQPQRRANADFAGSIVARTRARAPTAPPKPRVRSHTTHKTPVVPPRRSTKQVCACVFVWLWLYVCARVCLMFRGN
jgi:hypothetical protein